MVSFYYRVPFEKSCYFGSCEEGDDGLAIVGQEYCDCGVGRTQRCSARLDVISPLECQLNADSFNGKGERTDTVILMTDIPAGHEASFNKFFLADGPSATL